MREIILTDFHAKQKEAIAKMHKDRKEYLASYYSPKVKINENDFYSYI